MIASFTKSLGTKVGMPADVFAKQTCKQILRKSMPAHHAIGFAMASSKFAMLLPHGAMDGPYRKMMGFDATVPAGTPEEETVPAACTARNPQEDTAPEGKSTEGVKLGVAAAPRAVLESSTGSSAGSSSLDLATSDVHQVVLEKPVSDHLPVLDLATCAVKPHVG